MEIEIIKIIPNEVIDFPFIEVNLCISKESKSFRESAEITIFVDKKLDSMSEIKASAISKARAFLSQAVSVY